MYELTSRMCADIYTKAFTDPAKWTAACELINIVNPQRLYSLLSDKTKESLENAAEHTPEDNEDTVPQDDHTCSRKTPYWQVQQEKIHAIQGGAAGVMTKPAGALPSLQSRDVSLHATAPHFQKFLQGRMGLAS